MNIILIDDTPDHLELLSEFVQELRPRATIHPLRDGHDLAGYLERYPVDLILTDLLMPTIDGIELVREVRNSDRWSHLPIIAVTAMTQAPQAQKLREAGFDDLLHKPWDMEELTRILDRHLPLS